MDSLSRVRSVSVGGQARAIHRPSGRGCNHALTENESALSRLRTRGHTHSMGSFCRPCMQYIPDSSLHPAQIPHVPARACAQDTLAQLDALLATVNKNDCIIVTGDFNCQLRRNVQDCTDKWSMTSRNEDKGHDQEVLDLMRQYDLFTVDTKFEPRERTWSGKLR